jgi:hypothetical protein
MGSDLEQPENITTAKNNIAGKISFISLRSFINY